MKATKKPAGNSGSHNKHARASASAAERWTTCDASIGYIERLRAAGVIPKREPDNDYGLAGTYGHDLSERALRHILGKREDKEIRDKFRGNTAKFFAAQSYLHVDSYAELDEYVEYCLSHIRHDRDRVLIETQIELFYSPEETGTGDFAILHRNGDITIIDLKWRRSGLVKGVGNKQLAIYGNSLIQELRRSGMCKIKPNNRVFITAFNPLVPPFVDPWELSVNDLEYFCKPIQAAFDRIDQDDHTFFVPSEEACEWCPAREVCIARARGLTRAIPDDLTTDHLSDEDLVELFAIKGSIDDFFSNIATSLQRRLESGEKVKGIKLVETNARRKYKDEDEAKKWLLRFLPEDDVIRKSLVPFGEVLRALKKDQKENFEKTFLYKPKGKPKLALGGDERRVFSKIKAALFD